MENRTCFELSRIESSSLWLSKNKIEKTSPLVEFVLGVPTNIIYYGYSLLQPPERVPHHHDTITRFRRIQLSHYDIVFFLTIFLVKNEPFKPKKILRK